MVRLGEVLTMKILKIKLQIFLTGFILYQIGLVMHKQEQGHTMPTLSPTLITEKISGFTKPAYASDNGGIPVDIPYSPYMGSDTSSHGQMNASAQAQAQQMLQNGDISKLEDALRNDPQAAAIFGLR